MPAVEARTAETLDQKTIERAAAGLLEEWIAESLPEWVRPAVWTARHRPCEWPHPGPIGCRGTANRQRATVWMDPQKSPEVILP
jgi:hypothetical protein